jgi:FSR family fosmidomycin resistance protein-like MFS transporter
MFLLPIQSLPPHLKMAPETHGIEKHDVIMMMLLLGIAFRSVAWNVLENIHQGNHGLLLAMAGAAMTGKLFGGWIADRIGWKLYCWIALGGAGLLLSFGRESAWLLLPGIALLQSATPVALAAMYRALPRFPATASGLALGLAIAAGGIPFAVPGSGISSEWMWLLIPALGAALLYGIALSQQNKKRLLRN